MSGMAQHYFAIGNTQMAALVPVNRLAEMGAHAFLSKVLCCH